MEKKKKLLPEIDDSIASRPEVRRPPGPPATFAIHSSTLAVARSIDKRICFPMAQNHVKIVE